MPNWCCTNVCFKGKLENITKLASDIYKATEWAEKHYHQYCNIWYLLSLNNLDVDSYTDKYKNEFHYNFRGSVIDNYPVKIEYFGEYALLYPMFETAWSMDYNILHLLSILYDVEFSSYSEEPSMEVYTKCRNGSIDTYDYDTVIVPDYEQVEEEMNKDIHFDIDYCFAGKENSADMRRQINDLERRGIKYESLDILDFSYIEPVVHGVYYMRKPNGVIYED